MTIFELQQLIYPFPKWYRQLNYPVNHILNNKCRCIIKVRELRCHIDMDFSRVLESALSNILELSCAIIFRAVIAIKNSNELEKGISTFVNSTTVLANR